jgi:hypothetical protein
VAPTQPALLYLFGLPPAFAEESETVGSSPESLADGFTAPVLNKLARRCFEREVLASADDSVIERTHAGFAVLRLLGEQRSLRRNTSVTDTAGPAGSACRIEATRCIPLRRPRNAARKLL